MSGISARALRPAPLAWAVREARPGRWPGRLATVAVAAQLTVSANLLAAFGIPYASDGGAAWAKLHPASWLAYAAGAALVLGATGERRLASLLRDQAAAFGAAALLLLCVPYTLATVGRDHAVIFLDSFLPSCALLAVLGEEGAAARRRIARVALALIALNAALAIAEAVLRRHLVPIAALAGEREFRAAALYDHPLTGAAASVIGLFATWVVAPRGLRLALTALLLAGLLAFGGRAALAVGLGFVTIGGLGLALRRGAKGVAAFALAAVVAAGGFAALLRFSPLGGRILANLYWDSSAASRATEWRLLGMLQPGEALFGMGYARLATLTATLGMRTPFTDVESFWLLMFLQMGAVGYALFLAGLSCLLAGLWRRAGASGRACLVALLVIATTSNSLGRKNGLLVVLAPVVLAAPRRVGELVRHTIA